ncbi:MAG TPA: TadE/TadG family type IV pilus assembly protein [Rhizomicrobium sp.]|jgi:Flp pilus assembly protein TadG|nr:TadE/TadG family type IV pilus assembly protein [Rhizomicrobium sp.]
MLNWARKFWRAKDGLAAIEFAMLAPVLAAMFLGSIELADALDCEQKVTGMAATAADLVAQETQIKNSDIANVFSAINSIVFPYPTTGLKIVVSSLVDNGSGGGKVAWSDAQNTSARVVGTNVTVPTGVITSGGSVILTEVTYPYASPVSDYLTGTTNMSETFYARPRRSTTISRVP